MEDFNEKEKLLFYRIKEKLASSVEFKVDEHLKKDRELVKKTVSTVSKAFVWIIAFLSVLLTFLGIKTYGNIEGIITKNVEKKIDKEIKGANILGDYEKRAKQVYVKSLIEYYQMKMIVSKHKKDDSYFTFKPLLEKGHTVLLLEQLKDSIFGDDSFNEILDIISNTDPRDKFEKSRIIKCFKEIINNKNLYNREAKLEKIFHSSIDQDIRNLEDEALRIMLKEKNEKLRLSTISYLKTSPNQSVLVELENISKSNNTSIKHEAIKSISYINFKNKIVDDFIKEYKTKSINLKGTKKMIEILYEILDGTSYKYKRIDRRNYQSEAKEYVAENLIYLIKKGVTFNSYYFRGEKDKMRLSFLYNGSTYRFKDKYLNLLTKQGIETKIFEIAKKDVSTFKILTKAIIRTKNISSEYFKPSHSLVVYINDIQKVKFSDSDINKKDIGSKIYLHVDEENRLVAKWLKKSKTGRTIMMKYLTDVSQFKSFRLIDRFDNANDLFYLD
ncbi:MAG: hypothetical protein JXQ93_05970 [Flavobacteriaceae bacterium]